MHLPFLWLLTSSPAHSFVTGATKNTAPSLKGIKEEQDDSVSKPPEIGLKAAKLRF